MAHAYSRQIIVYAVPAIAVLLSYLWFKRKRNSKASDPGENPIVEKISSALRSSPKQQKFKSAASCSNTVEETHPSSHDILTPVGSPKLVRVNSSTPSSPIDIILPRELRSQRTSPVVISDEDLDIEIEKIKSMRSCSAEKHTTRFGGADFAQSRSDQEPDDEEIHTTPQSKKSSASMPSGTKMDASPIAVVKPKMTPQSKGSAKKGSALKMTKVEDKLNNLKISNSKQQSPKKEVEAQQQQQQIENEAGNHSDEHNSRQSAERDSANHSPADVMLASPSLSCISDNQSEGSSDSGKGGSDVATPPSRTPAGDASIPLIYEFTIPQLLVGKLIGRFGSFVTDIKEKTRAHIVIRKHPSISKLKLCVIEGQQSEIDNALKMIRDRFPIKKFPEVTLEQVAVTMPVSNVPITSDHLYSKLVEGVNNDTIVSCMVSPGHLFLQQPTHPSYPHLQVLSRFMTVCYSNDSSPSLPKPIQENTVCVAQSVGEWYRAMVLSTDETTDSSYVTFLDYGGYAVLPNSDLKQIRGDFLLLPFQAAECYLANIKPAGGDDAQWCEEAFNLVAELTKGALALTQIAEYDETGSPLVLMYILVGPQEVVFLNDELVKRGYAEYIVPPPSMLDHQQQQQHFEEAATTSRFVADDVEGAVGGIVA